MLGHTTLSEYYLTNFGLMQYHKYSLTELDEMMPWERDVYTAFVRKHVFEEDKRNKERESGK